MNLEKKLEIVKERSKCVKINKFQGLNWILGLFYGFKVLSFFQDKTVLN